jgi:hypothetical protein
LLRVRADTAAQRHLSAVASATATTATATTATTTATATTAAATATSSATTVGVPAEHDSAVQQLLSQQPVYP